MTVSTPLDDREDFSSDVFFPINRDRSPCSAGWADADPGTKEIGKFGYGILQGRGHFVLDADCHKGEPGLENLKRLEGEIGAFEPTFTVRTPSGGLHLYFQGEGVHNSAHKIARGIDIRGHRGYVVGPGSPYWQADSGEFVGHYVIEDDALRAPAPPELLRRILAGTPLQSQPSREAHGVPKTLEDLEKTVGKKGHEHASFWRSVVKGVFPISLPASGWNDYLTRACYWLADQAPDWADVYGETVVQLMGPSLSHMHQKRRELGQDLKHLDSASIASLYDRATDKIRAVNQADRLVRDAIASAKKDHTSPPKILQCKTSYYLMDGDRAQGPYIKDQLWNAARDMQIPGVELHMPSKTGLIRMSPNDLMELYGQNGSLDEVVQSLTAQDASLVDGTLTIPSTRRPKLGPLFHGQIDYWMDLMGGDPLKDFVAVSLDLEEACPALWLTGVSGSGKTILVRGLAQMWGEVSAVPLERALGKYNAALAKCPIVDGQEKIPTGWRNQPRIDDLKALITDTKRTIEEKYVANSTLKGALRIVLSSNNMQMIKGSRDITPDDAEALTSRMIHIDVTSPAAADYLKTVSVQEDWLDNGMLARHFLWLTENRNPARGTRLRLPPSSTSDMGAVMRENSHASFQALKVLLTWLETWSRATEPSQDDRVQWSEKDDTIRVTATGMQALLKREYGDRYSVQSLGATLRLLSNDRKIGTKVASGNYPPMWVIPIETVAVWAEREGWSTRDEVLALTGCAK